MKYLPLAALAMLAAACTSPESTRTLGGGPGADLGKRPPTVVMHEGSKPYEGTPRLIPAESAPVDTAQHARTLSMR